MSSISVFAQNGVVYSRLAEVLNCPELAAAITKGEIPTPVVQHWECNLHQNSDVPRRQTHAGGFRVGPPPARINIYQHWMTIPKDLQVITPCHELFHAKAWQEGLFDVFKKHQLSPAEMISDIEESWVLELYDQIEETWVDAQVFAVIPKPAHRVIAAKIASNRRWREGIRKSQHNTRELMLGTIAREYFFANLARIIPRSCSKSREMCTREGSACALLRRRFCKEFILEQEIGELITRLLESRDPLAYWEALIALLDSTIGIMTRVDPAWNRD